MLQDTNCAGRVNILFDITGIICGGASDNTPIANTTTTTTSSSTTTLQDKENNCMYQQDEEEKQQEQYYQQQTMYHDNNAIYYQNPFDFCPAKRNNMHQEEQSLSFCCDALNAKVEEHIKKNHLFQSVMDQKEKRVGFCETAETFYYDKPTKEENEERWYNMNDYKNIKINYLKNIFEVCNNENSDQNKTIFEVCNIEHNNSISQGESSNNNHSTSENHDNNSNIHSFDMQLLEDNNEEYCLRGLERYTTTTSNGKIILSPHDATARSRKLYVHNILKLQRDYKLVNWIRLQEKQLLQHHHNSIGYHPSAHENDSIIQSRFSAIASRHSKRDRSLAKRRASQDERDAIEVYLEDEEKEEESRLGRSII